MSATSTLVPEDATGLATVRPARPLPVADATGRRSRSAFPPLRGLLPLVVALGIWQVAASESSPYFPPPSRWLQGLRDLWAAGTLWPSAVDTLTTFALAIVAATVLGTLVGLVIGASPRLDRALGPSLEFARAMPPAAVVPIATLLIGYDQRMKVAVVVSAAVWSVLLNARAGLRRLDPVLLDMARSLHLGTLDRARKVTIPALLPSIFLGVRVAAPVALVITLLVELLTQVNGIGALIGTAQRTYQAGQVYGLILVAGLFSFLVNALVSVLEAATFRHRPR
jgi:ABC-type nitrate/sulfonate/bicarbonate transport system permease component